MLLTDVHDLLSGENIVAILIVQFKKHLAAAVFCEGLGVCARQVHMVSVKILKFLTTGCLVAQKAESSRWMHVFDVYRVF